MRIARTTVLALIFALTGATAREAAAQAGEEVFVDVNGRSARLIACFEDVMMPAKVLVEHVLITPEKRQYVKRRDGTVELVEYPAVYRQKRTLLEPAYRELREIPCKPKRSFFGF